ncbi:MAG: nicotinate phosphoribosyltransferase [Oscillospiraceae bacterium]|nr:nicotinate phosphoribosyltransferase [Oscillospiraceae bacterium]
MDRNNLTLLCDYYEYTMANGYHLSGQGKRKVYFDAFFRTVPDGGGFAICAGLSSVIDYIKNLHFDADDIAYLESKHIFDKSWIDSLRDFRFTGDVWAVPEGTPVFPGEPLMIVRADAEQAQIIETFALLCLNHQSLIATKANRIVRAAEGRAVMEFGARRAQGADAAFFGARAAYIAGCAGTSCTLTDKFFDIPALGTMAHSWIQLFDDEYTAFKAFCKIYPNNASLLIDTYNVLKSGLPNAIRVFKELGITKCSVRIDSGDITYLTKRMRQTLDDAGLPDCKIIVSNSLDEDIIRDVIAQGGVVDSFGVGERLITAKSDSVFGGVYKLTAIEDDNGNIVPKIKISENVQKITTPHFKKVYRIFENATGKAIADYVCVHDEVLDPAKPLELFDPDYTWKRKTLTDYTARELLVRVFDGGRLVYAQPTVREIRDYCAAQLDTMWDEVKRFENPHNYYVDLSQKLWDVKHDLLKKNS